MILVNLFLQYTTLFYNKFEFIMKPGNKVQSLFMSKFSNILTKFKDNSTIQVGHQQLKTIFGQFALKDILNAFISKMDTSQQLSQRQKRQYTKVYIAFVQNYKEEVLQDQFYERILQSLNKKSIGVNEVIAHLCKTLLNRIQDPEILYPFVSIIINIFHNHIQIPKILKQIIEIIDSSVVQHLQQTIIAILHQKINNAKLKHEYLQAIQSLVLNLEQKLSVQYQVTGFLLKYLKHDDWNCRKICVDIGYAFLVIKQEINQNIHSLIKQLKYDKIKHVRDSVTNYEVLYKQIYGQQVVVKPPPKNLSIRQTKIKVEQTKKIVAKSPAPVAQRQYSQNSNQKRHSHDKLAKPKVKNQNFFKNAKNSDVIRINQQNKSVLVQNNKQQINQIHNFSVHVPRVKLQQSKNTETKKNFEDYLKKRSSPRMSIPSSSAVESGIKKFQNQKSNTKSKNMKVEETKLQRFNYQNELQNFKKKNKIDESQSFKIQIIKQSSFVVNQTMKPNQDISLSFAQSKLTNNIYDQLLVMFKQFQKKVNSRLDIFQHRLSALQGQKKLFSFNQKMDNGRVFPQNYENKNDIKQQSPKSMFYNQSPNESNWQSSFSENIQSNLQEKVRSSIANENWDQAFTLALTNNKKNILLNLLERCVFPTDRTVQECILLEIKKLLGYTSTLKWLKYYLTQKNLSEGRLVKLRQDLQKKKSGDNKNYEMMRQLVLNQITDKLQNLN